MGSAVCTARRRYVPEVPFSERHRGRACAKATTLAPLAGVRVDDECPQLQVIAEARKGHVGANLAGRHPPTLSSVCNDCHKIHVPLTSAPPVSGRALNPAVQRPPENFMNLGILTVFPYSLTVAGALLVWNFC